jgi:hypothetical protein
VKETGTLMSSIYDGRKCIGFILRRGKAGTEAFDLNESSLGIFESDRAAADAVSHAARGQ